MSQHYHHISQAFEEFEKSTKNEWIKKVKLDASGKNVDHLLSGKSREGLQILPFYTEEDLPASLPSDLKVDMHWKYHEYLLLHSDLDLKDVNATILQALYAGASGIDIQIQGDESLDKDLFSGMLDQVQVSRYPISFYLPFRQLDSFISFLNYAEDLQLQEKIKGSLYIYPDFSNHVQNKSAVQSLANFFSSTQSGNYQLLGITSAPFVNAGAHVVQELAFTLSYMVACIDDLTDRGIEPATLFNHLEITLSTQSNYYIDIAKFRAIRILLSQVAEAYQREARALHHWKIKAVSGIWNKTVYDPVSNMLRNTTEAMAAIIGGCNTIALLPHNFAYEQKRKFSSRMARNISHLLQYETQLNKVVDPAAGSYFLEHLTHQIVIQSWQEFLSIEKAGGYMEAVDKDIIDRNIADVRSRKQKDIRIRRQPFVGSTRYPNPDEHLANALFYPDMMHDSNRGPALFENLRYQVDQYVARGNRRPKVGVILFPVASEIGLVNARVAFIKDLLTCGGIHFEEYVYKEGLAEQEFDTQVWILCSTNQFYDHQLPELLKQSAEFRHKVLYLAGLTQTSLEELQDIGIHDRIYAGADIHMVLTDLLHQLGIVL